MNKGLPGNQIKRHPAKQKTPHLLLRDPNFVSGPGDLEANAAPLACEASALTAELTAPKTHLF